jgi:hypothetical protein
MGFSPRECSRYIDGRHSPGGQSQRGLRRAALRPNYRLNLSKCWGLFDHWREATGGAPDASAETAVRLWQKGAAEHRQPTQTEIERAVEAMQQTHWQVDCLRGAAIHLTDTPLAFASFTKSYIAGRAVDAALAAGVTGVMLNVGGDIVVRGNLAQIVDIANRLTSAENDVAMDQILVRDRAVATSGSYRCGFNLISNSSGTQPESLSYHRPADGETGRAYSLLYRRSPRSSHNRRACHNLLRAGR